MSTQQYMHAVKAIEVKDDAGQLLGYRWVCSCHGRGSTIQSSAESARYSGEKHAKKMRPRPRWGG